MRDADYPLTGWCPSVRPESDDDTSLDLMREDSGDGSGVSEMNGMAREDEAFKASQSPSTGLFTVTVGVPRRFGNPVDSIEETSDRTVTPELSKLREMLKKVKVNEALLHSAIARLGGGEKGLRAVINYIMFFQASKEKDPGSFKPDSFTHGLEQLILRKGQPSQEEAPNVGTVCQSIDSVGPQQRTHDLELQHVSGVVQGPNQQSFPNWHSQGQEEWYRTGHFVDPHRGGYMENPPLMGAFFHPNFYCPCPPTFAGYGPFNPLVQPVFFPVMAGPNVHPVPPDSIQAAAIIRASRKIRIARHRGHTNGQHQTQQPAAAGPTASGPLVSGGQRKSQAQPDLGFTAAGQGCSTGALKFLLHKELKPSDVSSLGRTVLPKKEAETHLPYLDIREGITIAMEDFDTGQSWMFRYRFWPNNKSRMYILENTRDFIKAHNLQEGDLLLLYRNPLGSYVVQGKKSAAQSGDMIKSSETAAEVAPGEEQLQKKQKSIV